MGAVVGSPSTSMCAGKECQPLIFAVIGGALTGTAVAEAAVMMNIGAQEKEGETADE